MKGSGVTLLVVLVLILSFLAPVMPGSGGKGKAKIEMDEPEPVPSAFPTSMLDPFMSDVSTVGFFVAGVIDIVGANVIVDVDSTTDAFADGAGNFGSFSGTSNANGVYRVSVIGLNEAFTYYYRVRFVDGADTTYFPGAGAAVGPERIGTSGMGPVNTAVSMISYERITGTPQDGMLAYMTVDNSWPLTFITVPAPAGFAAFNGNNLRDKTTGYDYTQNDATSTFRLGSYGMWDDGTGTEYWASNMTDNTYIGIPVPLQRVDTYPPYEPQTTSWDLYNGRNFVTFSSDTSGRMVEDVCYEIVAYMNANYGEGMIIEDIAITKFDSVTGLYKTSYFWSAITMWWENFQLYEGICYIIDIDPGTFSVQPRNFELPNLEITTALTIDLYNGQNFRGLPVTTATLASEVAIDVIAYINANYGEGLADVDVTVTKYDSTTGLYTTCYYWAAVMMWWSDFAIAPGEGYIIEIASGALSVQPRVYIPS